MGLYTLRSSATKIFLLPRSRSRVVFFFSFRFLSNLGVFSKMEEKKRCPTHSTRCELCVSCCGHNEWLKFVFSLNLQLLSECIDATKDHLQPKSEQFVCHIYFLQRKWNENEFTFKYNHSQGFWPFYFIQMNSSSTECISQM